ncbi:glycosyltransferase family 4 protein [Fontivita pretiosa]|uniref:glycosyltransferase family 4 protein n=1 Tax=Fontivita pretiosa TaxID=2989684 RepID=UPI003D176482
MPEHGYQAIRVAIEINVLPGVAGGIVQSTVGLVRSLGQLDGPERYLLIAERNEQRDWIQPYCGANQQVRTRAELRRGASPWAQTNGQAHRNGSQPLSMRLRRALKPTVQMIRRVVGRLTPQSAWPSVPVSDGLYESLGCDVLHFPTQSFTLCALPTIYNPHDLQHLHYPQFFSPVDLALRETIYRTACELANTVVVGSEWIKQDVVRHYRLDPQKVQIIPWAPPTEFYPPLEPERLEQARRRLSLPQTYMLYPAVTWPHKNHLRLLEAIAELRDRRGMVVNLVCTGSKYPFHWPKIEQRVRELRLEPQVRFLGFVSEEDLRAVYRLAQFLILPTLFEADSCPIHEAWKEGLAVASADITALPDQVGDAGLLFDPRSVSAIADAIARMSTDAELRRQLIERGHRRVRDFDWERTARAYRAVYRRAAGLTLNDEDRWLLEWDWMRYPNRSPASAAPQTERLSSNTSAALANIANE